ncbi:MAG: hypothetical protein KJO07_04360, partial [Deltaproteobacteria bacterium]|nr:hypothetical protein [Deltaproteobacteria bacterium]
MFEDFEARRSESHRTTFTAIAVVTALLAGGIAIWKYVAAKQQAEDIDALLGSGSPPSIAIPVLDELELPGMSILFPDGSEPTGNYASGSVHRSGFFELGVQWSPGSMPSAKLRQMMIDGMLETIDGQGLRPSRILSANDISIGGGQGAQYEIQSGPRNV